MRRCSRTVSLVDARRFEEAVAAALDALPEWVREAMDNVAVVVEDRDADDPGLLGLYQGCSLTDREGYGALDLPDVITLYREAILEVCASDEEVVDEVTITLVHEVAHHFGIDDEELDRLGWS